MTSAAILEAFATAERNLPREALRQAAAQWQEVGPVLLDMLDRAASSTVVTDRDEGILFFGIFVAAQLRETRAFAPLCALCRQADRIEQVLGDGITENLSAILARLYDGDPAPLKQLIEALDADEFARCVALESLAWLTAAGQIGRAETADYLRDLYTTLQPQADSPVWVGWQQAVAFLGLENLVPQVESAFDRGFISKFAMSFGDFRDDFRVAQQAGSATAPFAGFLRNMARHDDAVALLSTWYAFQPPEEREPATAFVPDETLRSNPFRGVGRNAPCPCGSGKKFKKCCLGKVA
jgi:hypothetical protein